MDANNEQYERYKRQVPLPGFGKEGQEKLSRAKVLVVGAGGLGCPVIQYLAAAGIGTIGIIDGDRVELSNLHRQVLYAMDDIGHLKAAVAAGKVRKVNPQIDCREYPFIITNKNALALIGDYDIVVDCTDNFVSRYILADACRLLDKPLVFAAVFQFEGQVAVFNMPAANGQKSSYRDLFPEPPDAASAPDCNIAGVLGVLPGIIGMLQATEVIKIITSIGETLSGKLLNYDIRSLNNIIIELDRRKQQTGPVTREEFESMDYEWFCGSSSIPGIDKVALTEMLAIPNTIAIDVREMNESPEASFPHRRIPLSAFNQLPDLSGFDNIIVFCQGGTRSVKAAGMLKEKQGTEINIFHLLGGLTAYNQD